MNARVCPICSKEMRYDNIGRHIMTHCRQIIKSNKTMCKEALENKHTTVYCKSYKEDADGTKKTATRFAGCLGCGKHANYTPLYFGSIRWEDNSCDEFIRLHNVSCGKHHNPKWYTTNMPLNMKIKKNTRCSSKKNKSQKNLSVMLDPRDALILEFPTVFDMYNWNTDDESDEEEISECRASRLEQRNMSYTDMLQEISNALKKSQSTTNKLRQNQNQKVNGATLESNRKVNELEDRILELEEQLYVKTEESDKIIDYLTIRIGKYQEDLNDHGLKHLI